MAKTREEKNAHHREWIKKNWTRVYENVKRYRMDEIKRDPIRVMLRNKKSTAKARGVPFTITKDDLGEMPKVCPVLGIPLRSNWGSGRRGAAIPDSPSLDRIVPALGYVPGNVRIISQRANILKGDATLEELRALVAYVERETIKRPT